MPPAAEISSRLDLRHNSAMKQTTNATEAALLTSAATQSPAPAADSGYPPVKFSIPKK